eukprot:230375_1
MNSDNVTQNVEMDTSSNPMSNNIDQNDNEEKKAPNHTDKDIQDTEHKPEHKPFVDIAFVLDCTGSMSSYIQSCKDNINQISSTINKETNNEYNINFGLILYRDIPPQDKTFITKRIPFTPIPLKIQLELSKTRASGGGDSPEALTSALYDCYKNLKWRENSIKVIVVITDAPPHGLEQHIQDGFPNGDPDTFNIEKDSEVQQEGVNDADNKTFLNVIDIVKSIRDELNGSIYSVACEPGLSCNTDFANDFMQYIAQYTNGKFLPLSSATLLPDVIVGSVKQQINLNNLTYKLDEEIEKIKAKHGNDISSNEINKIIMQKWKNEGIKKKEISIGTLYRNKRSKYNINLLMNEQKIKSLKDFKTNCKIFPRLKESDFRHLNVDKYKNSKKKISTKTTHKMKLINTKMKLLQQIWDKYIDPYCNGDVDMEEWCLGMNKLNVKLSEIQQRKVFNCLDNEESGFIDKDDFIQFLESKYENIELIQYQKRILDAIRKQNIHINNIIEKDEIITKQPEKTIVIDALNIKLNSNIRPTISDLGNCGLIPQNWLLDLYGLSDTIRKKHSRMESAVQDLKSCLNVPPILADVVARDVVDEIECVDPYLESNNNNNNDTNDNKEEELRRQWLGKPKQVDVNYSYVLMEWTGTTRTATVYPCTFIEFGLSKQLIADGQSTAESVEKRHRQNLAKWRKKQAEKSMMEKLGNLFGHDEFGNNKEKKKRLKADEISDEAKEKLKEIYIDKEKITNEEMEMLKDMLGDIHYKEFIEKYNQEHQHNVPMGLQTTDDSSKSLIRDKILSDRLKSTKRRGQLEELADYNEFMSDDEDENNLNDYDLLDDNENDIFEENNGNESEDNEEFKKLEKNIGQDLANKEYELPEKEIKNGLFDNDSDDGNDDDMAWTISDDDDDDDNDNMDGNVMIKNKTSKNKMNSNNNNDNKKKK